MTDTQTQTQDKQVDVLHASDATQKQIVLPAGMDYRDAMKWLERKNEEQSRKVSINETLDAYPLDGALALHKAMARKYGWTHLIPTPSFFGENPPAMIGVRVGAGQNDVVQVAWGRMEIPGVSGYIETGFTFEGLQPKFVINGVVRRKHEGEVAELAQEARKILRAESIYRGKALRVKFVSKDEANSLEDFNPKFIDISGVREDELIFPEETRELISTNLFTPIEKTELCRKHKIPLKRGVLLAGPYGVGKTLTANVAAKKCVENKWTFIYLETVTDLQQAIHFARLYSPAVIFAEDIDQLVRQDRKRDDVINGVLNTIDGVDTKSSEIVVALTTNHVDQVSKAMLRPGRLDAVIHVPPPDMDAAMRLVRLYARDLLDPSEDLTIVGQELSGRIPAVIREVVERSKLGALSRSNGTEALRVTSRDLVLSARGMLAHLELLAPKEEDKRSDVEKAAAVQANGFEKAATAIVEAVRKVPPAVSPPVDHRIQA